MEMLVGRSERSQTSPYPYCRGAAWAFRSVPPRWVQLLVPWVNSRRTGGSQPAFGSRCLWAVGIRSPWALVKIQMSGAPPRRTQESALQCMSQCVVGRGLCLFEGCCAAALESTHWQPSGGPGAPWAPRLLPARCCVGGGCPGSRPLRSSMSKSQRGPRSRRAG